MRPDPDRESRAFRREEEVNLCQPDTPGYLAPDGLCRQPDPTRGRPSKGAHAAHPDHHSRLTATLVAVNRPTGDATGRPVLVGPEYDAERLLRGEADDENQTGLPGQGRRRRVRRSRRSPRPPSPVRARNSM